MAAEREHDVVLYGATGFTGALTAEYLARNAPPTTRWAIAGRSREKLEHVRDGLAGDGEAPDLIEADSTDEDSLQAMAGSARVVISTVGPYIRFGFPLVAACAANGTDYIDLTGEPEFVDRVWLRHHEQARESGARLVHSCGFDSIPHDLGARFCVEALPEGVPLKVHGFVRAGGTFSGGTYDSLLTAFSRARQYAAVRRQRARREADPPGRHVRSSLAMVGPDRPSGGWSVPFPSIDVETVVRSARALQRYGPDFTYAHSLVMPNLPIAAGLIAGAPVVLGARPAPPDAQAAAPPGARGRTGRGAPGPELVRRALRGRGRRRARGVRGARRRPRLRRDLEDAGRVRALPGPRRAAGERRAGHARGGDGRGADRAPAGGRHRVRRARAGERRLGTVPSRRCASPRRSRW